MNFSVSKEVSLKIYPLLTPLDYNVDFGTWEYIQYTLYLRIQDVLPTAVNSLLYIECPSWDARSSSVFILYYDNYYS